MRDDFIDVEDISDWGLGSFKTLRSESTLAVQLRHGSESKS